MFDEVFDQTKHWLTYHGPNGDTIPKYTKVRDAGLVFARVIEELCPNVEDRAVAIRKIREAVMFANASIACDIPKE